MSLRFFYPAAKARLLVAAATALLYSLPAQASEAVVVELYRDCRLADTTIIIDEGILTPAQSAEVKARAAAASQEPRAALPQIVRLLKSYGIEDVEVSRQGFGGCEPNTSGKYVEAVGTYCGAKLTRAELLVDRTSVMDRSDPDMTFDVFLREAVKKLKEQGIHDRPVVSIENAPDCGESD